MATIPASNIIDPFRLEDIRISYYLEGGRRKPKLIRIKPSQLVSTITSPAPSLPNQINTALRSSHLPELPIELWDYIAEFIPCNPQHLYRLLSLCSRDLRTYSLPLFVRSIQILAGHKDFDKRMSFISSPAVRGSLKQITIRSSNFTMVHANSALAHPAGGLVSPDLIELGLSSMVICPQDLATLGTLERLETIRVSSCTLEGFDNFDWTAMVPTLPITSMTFEQIADPTVLVLWLCLTRPGSLRNLKLKNCRFPPSSISLPLHLSFPEIQVLHLGESDIFALQTISWSTIFPNLIAIQITGTTTPKPPSHRNQKINTIPPRISIPSLKAIFGVQDPDLLEALTTCDQLSHISLTAHSFDLEHSFILLRISTTLRSLSLTTWESNSVLEQLIPELIALELLHIAFVIENWYSDTADHWYDTLYNPSVSTLPQSIQFLTIQLHSFKEEPPEWISRLSNPLWRSKYPNLRMLCVMSDNWRDMMEGKNPLIGYDFERDREVVVAEDNDEEVDSDGKGQGKIRSWIWRDQVRKQLSLDDAVY